MAVVRRAEIVKRVAAESGEKTSALMRYVDAGIPVEMLGELVDVTKECGAANKMHFISLMNDNSLSIYEMGEIYKAKDLTNGSAVQLCQLIKRFPGIPIDAEEIVSVVNRIHEVAQEEYISSSISNVINLAEKGRFLSWEIVLEYIEGSYWPNDDK